MDAGASPNDHTLDQVRRAALVEWEAMAPGWDRRREYLRQFSKGITDWMVARFSDFEDYWSFIREFAGAVAILLRSFSDEERAAVREATERATQGFRTPSPGLSVNALAS